MLLGEVLKKINKNFKLIKFQKIRLNSKECQPNDIFFSLKGNKYNGNDYINDAIKNGAKIIVSNLKFIGFNKNKILFIYSPDPRKLLSEVANTIYNYKPKNIIAVTGTNGKTSICNFFYQILNLNNVKVASIGTSGVQSKTFNIKTSNTTMDVINTHKILNKLKKINIDNVILEASSHGLKQSRLDNINFNSAVFTNLSRDHLDYHNNYNNYLNAKLILFRKLLKNRGNIIYDSNIKQSKILNSIAKKRKLRKICINGNLPFIKILNIHKINNKKKVTFLFKKDKFTFKTKLIGDLQIRNLMYAIVIAYLSKISISNIVSILHKIKPVAGRLQKIGKLKNKSHIILDYAHTPDALKLLFEDIKREYPLSNISIVFGCGGNRDIKKRKLMGSIADKYCEKIYITDDNPRFENPKFIRNQIAKGIKTKSFKDVPSRSKAINIAVKELNAGDVLIVSGKGDENYQEFEKKKFFSDKQEILKSINSKNASLSNSLKTNIFLENIKKKSIVQKKIIDTVSFDSRKLTKNSIFFGVKGKKFNGNNFAKNAIKNGAIISYSNIKNKNSRIIYKQNPLKFLNKICMIYRKSLGANNIAITGSSGKTSLKELTGFCFKKLDKTYFSNKSFNNKYGVPLTIFNAPINTKYSIFEVGMDKKGEIDYLTNLIKPDVGVITNISYAHIKNFKNLYKIALAKSEIIKNILPGGTAIFNRDDKYFNLFNKIAKSKNLKIISFSKKNPKSDVTILNKKRIKNKFLVKFKIFNYSKNFLISKELIHYKENILASLCLLSNYFEINKLKKNLFNNFRIPEGRGSLKKYYTKNKNIIIIDESYNSNPHSLKFSVEKFDKNYKEKNKKFLLLGDMLELGHYSKRLHQNAARFLNKSKVNKVYIYGELIKHTFNKLKPQIRGKILKSNIEVLKLIKKDLPNKSYLMIKGSNSSGLNKIVQNL